MPEREAVAAAAATTAARDLRPESSRRQLRPLQRPAPGPLVSRTRALVEEQGRREARLGSASGAPRAPPSFFVPAPGAAALVPARLPGPSAGGESPTAPGARISLCGAQRVGCGSLPTTSARCFGPGRSGAGACGLGAWGRRSPARGGGLGREPQRGRDEPGPAGGGEREASLLLATGIPLGAGERRGSHS